MVTVQIPAVICIHITTADYEAAAEMRKVLRERSEYRAGEHCVVARAVLHALPFATQQAVGVGVGASGDANVYVAGLFVGAYYPRTGFEDALYGLISAFDEQRSASEAFDLVGVPPDPDGLEIILDFVPLDPTKARDEGRYFNYRVSVA